MDEHGWVSAHLFYQGNLDTLIVELVSPLLRQLMREDLITGYFFIRHWDGGSHVRLRVRPADATAANLTRHCLERSCTAYFALAPAPDRIDPAQYREEAARWARLEARPDYSRSLYPNNSLAFIPYQREHNRYGRGLSMEAAERHFVEASRIALGLLAAGVTYPRRATAAFAMLVLTWLLNGGQPGAAGWRYATAAQLRSWQEHYERQEGSLRELTIRMRALAASPRSQPGDRSLAMWSGSIVGLLDALGDEPPSDAVTDLCAHLMCNRLGVAMAAEQQLRYLAARSLEAASPVPAQRRTVAQDF